MNTIFRKFKKNVLVLCSIAILFPHSAFANTSPIGSIDEANVQEVAQYAYDAFGRRIAKTVNGTTTYYLYSGNQLIAELDETGEMIRAYGWDLNDPNSTTPLWQAEVTNGKLDTADYHTFINDHLGTPQMAVNDAGEVTWKATSEAFGKTTPDVDNQITVNLRFPGQYYDEETGTHYNMFRDYNPNTGRYIQKDPIGLEGGINEYAYVQGNPLRYTDPTGEAIPIVVYYGYLGLLALAAAWGVYNTQQYSQEDQVGIPPYAIPNTQTEDICTEKTSIRECYARKEHCIRMCSDEALPTNDNGFGFWNCVNSCLGSDCLGRV